MTTAERVELLDMLIAGIPQPPRSMRRKKVTAVYELANRLDWARDTGLITGGEAHRIGLMTNLLVAQEKRDNPK
jgi:hypothetical protein